MAEKNEAEDASSISLKSPCHMKWDRQQNILYFTCFLMSQKCKFCFLLYLKEIYAQFVETNVLVKHNIYHELKLTIMDLDLQITWKHPVVDKSNKIYKFSRDKTSDIANDREVCFCRSSMCNGDVKIKLTFHLMFLLLILFFKLWMWQTI